MANQQVSEAASRQGGGTRWQSVAMQVDRNPHHAARCLACLLATLPLALTAGAGMPPPAPEDARESLLVSDYTRELLTSALRSPEPSVRSRALDTFRLMAEGGQSVSADLIRPLLDDQHPSVRAEALKVLLAILPEPESLPLLRQACGDASDAVCRCALAMFSRLRESESYTALLAMRSEMPPALLPSWSQALAHRAETPPAEVVQGLLADANPEVRLAAAEILARRPDLLPLEQRWQLLKDPYPPVRARAIEALKPEGASSEVREALLALLDDPAAVVCRAALEALAETEALPPLERIEPLLDHQDSQVRRAAVAAAARIGGKPAIAKLVERLADREVLVARAAGQGLARLADGEAFAALVGATGDSRDQVLAEAARALGLTKRPGALTALRRLVSNRSPRVRAAVYEALGTIGDADVVPLLVLQAPFEKGPARLALNKALGRIGDRRAVPHLLAEAHYPDPLSKGIQTGLFMSQPFPPPYSQQDTAVATAAVRSLGQIGDPAAIPGLAELADDVLRNADFWDAIAWSLGQLGDPQAGPALARLGIRGGIVQGNFSLIVPDSSRIEALRAIGKLQLRDYSRQMLNIAPVACSLPVRKVAAEVLTSLTGQKYTFNPPFQFRELFLQETYFDRSAALTPICRLASEP